MPRRHAVNRRRQIDCKYSERANGHYEENQRDCDDEPRVAVELSPRELVSGVRHDHQQRQHAKAGNESGAEESAKRQALGTAVMRRLVKPDRLERKHGKHARHRVEDNPDDKRREESQQIRRIGQLKAEDRRYAAASAGAHCRRRCGLRARLCCWSEVRKNGWIKILEQLRLLRLHLLPGRHNRRLNHEWRFRRRVTRVLVAALIAKRSAECDGARRRIALYLHRDVNNHPARVDVELSQVRVVLFLARRVDRVVDRQRRVGVHLRDKLNERWIRWRMRLGMKAVVDVQDNCSDRLLARLQCRGIQRGVGKLRMRRWLRPGDARRQAESDESHEGGERTVHPMDHIPSVPGEYFSQ